MTAVVSAPWNIEGQHKADALFLHFTSLTLWSTDWPHITSCWYPRLLNAFHRLESFHIGKKNENWKKKKKKIRCLSNLNYCIIPLSKLNVRIQKLIKNQWVFFLALPGTCSFFLFSYSFSFLFFFFSFFFFLRSALHLPSELLNLQGPS